MARAGVAAAVVTLALAPATAATAGSTLPTPWDGTNPFRCTLQQAGFGSVVPHPEADPFCIEFDKRRQSILQLGVVDFILHEPARVALAVPKCFYFQSDHWRGSIDQGQAGTKTYEFDGHYFFDKGKGDGGVWVTNFNIAGVSFNPSVLPGFPPQYAPYFGHGTGGVRTHDDVPADPACAARRRREPGNIYAPTGSSGSKRPARCMTPGGRSNAHRIGPVALGDPEGRVRRLLGPPAAVKRGFLRWCAKGGGRFLVGQPTDRSGELGDDPAEHTAMVFSSSPKLRYRRVGRGTKLSALRRRLGRARRTTRYEHTAVWLARPRSRVLFGVRHRRVCFVAVRNRGLVRGRAGIRTWLRRTR